MFIPIPIRFHDGREFHAIPVMNGMIVALNVMIFCLGWHPHVGPGTGVFSVVTYAFGHAGIWHLAGNMFALLVFGTPVNRRLGNGWYFIVYFSTVLAMGLFSRLCCGGNVLGASGAIFAVIAIALMLFPSARMDIAYFALFPVTLIAGVLSKPKHWVFWLLRWDVFQMRAYWGLFLIPFLEVWGLLWTGWNWTNMAHLFGLFCGVVAVLVLPPTITMNHRSRMRFVEL